MEENSWRTYPYLYLPAPKPWNFEVGTPEYGVARRGRSPIGAEQPPTQPNRRGAAARHHRASPQGAELTAQPATSPFLGRETSCYKQRLTQHEALQTPEIRPPRPALAAASEQGWGGNSVSGWCAGWCATAGWPGAPWRLAVPRRGANRKKWPVSLGCRGLLGPPDGVWGRGKRPSRQRALN
jgi:hypothetical protein